MCDETPELADFMMANGFMLEVFMLQMSLEIAASKSDPEAWARDFVSELHSRIDANELSMNDRRYPTHELARQGFDRLGSALTTILQLKRR